MAARRPSPRPLPRPPLAPLLAPLLLLLLLALLPGGRAQLGGCVLHSEDGVLIEKDYWDAQTVRLDMGAYWTKPLEDTRGKDYVYYTFINTENIDSIQMHSYNDDMKYFEVVPVDNTVEIRTSELFPEFEKDVVRSALSTFYLFVTITCNGQGNPMQLVLRVHDSNNFGPEMTQESWELFLPVPVNMGTQLLIAAGFDYDITGLGVVATVEATDPEVASWFSAEASTVVNRAFSVSLTTTMEIRTQEAISFTLRITDLGTQDEPMESKTTVVAVTFTPDLDQSVFSPRFEHPLYTTTVTSPEEVSGGGDVLAEPIGFDEGYADDLQLTLHDGGAHAGLSATEFVEARLVGETAKLFWREGLDAEKLAAFLEQPYALLVLTASAENAPQDGHTVVHLALPGAFADFPEDCPSTGDPLGCPTTECPSTDSPTTECPSTECPECPEDTPSTGDPSNCPSTECPLECPPTENPSTDCPHSPEDCPTTECPLECPPTEIPSTDCPHSPEDCPTTECPLECPPTEIPSTDCPHSPEDCPKTECPLECPPTESPTTECQDCSEYCSSTGDPVNCPATECPLTESPTQCQDCSEYCSSTGYPTNCPTTECPPTEAPSTACPDFPTGCPSTGDPSNCPSTECPPTEIPPIQCPSTECPDCPADCPSTGEPSNCPSAECPLECPSTSGSSEEPPELQLRFDRDAYTVQLNREAAKGDLVVQARLQNADNLSGVRFGLESVWETSPLALLELAENSGAVTLQVAPPPAGTYLYRLVATATNALPAQAELLVLGPAGVECGDGEVCFAEALKVVPVPEMEESQVSGTVLDAEQIANAGCSFTVLEGSEYFKVDSATGAVTVNAEDREDDKFGGAEAPVLRLLMQISCGGSDRNEELHAAAAAAARDAGDWVSAVGTVTVDPHFTVVLAVLQDINDNAPTFENPSLVVGFPDAALAQQLRLPALFTAQATDKDLGENAALLYSLNEAGAAYLQVYKETGTVHPRSDVAPPPDGHVVVVFATDCLGAPGDPGTHTGELSVTLRALSEEHLVEVRMEDALPEDAEKLLSDALGAGRDLRLLAATVLPGENAGARTNPAPLPRLLRARRAFQVSAESEDEGEGEGEDEGSEDEDDSPAAVSQLRVLLYSVRANQLEAADDFMEAVEKTLSDSGWGAQAAEMGGADSGHHGGGSSSSSNGGLVAAVITLGVLLALVLLAAGVAGYWFGIRPRRAQDDMLTTKTKDYNSDSSLRSVLAAIEPLSEDMIHPTPSSPSAQRDERELAPPQPQGLTLTPSPPLGASALRGPVTLGLTDENESVDYEQVGSVMSEGYEHPRPAPDHPYEELIALDPAPAPAPDHAFGADDDASVTSDALPRKSVFFNEEVDCIEIRM